MDFKEFNHVVDDAIEHIKTTLITKGKEYCRNNNPLHNFEEGVKITGKSREDVIWGFALKHFISIQDIKNDINEGKLPTQAVIDEKYGDLINYLVIEKASITDKINKDGLQ